MTDYTSATALASALDLQEPDDTTLTLVISAASRLVDSHCGRQFGPGASSAREFGPYSHASGVGILDPWCIAIYDASTVTAVKSDYGDDGTYETTWTSGTDYHLTPLNGVGPNGQAGWPYSRIVAHSNRTFPVGNYHAAVQVTAVWGWSAIPDDVTLATQMVAEEMYKAVREAPFGSANLTDFGPVFIRGNKRYQDLLMPYCKSTASDGRFLVA